MTSANSDHPQVTTRQRTVLLATDRNQSVLAEITDGKHTAIAYSTYGEQSAEQSVATALGFNGQLRESSIGWYILGNGYRAYNPVLMRFHSPDSWSPFGRGGLNAYMYCVGDPVNRVDPTGHVPWFHPKLTRYAKNTFNFFFGGAERTGSRRATNAQGRTVANLGGLQPEKTGEGKALATAAAAVGAGAPVHRSEGLYPGGDRHSSAKWGVDRPYVGPQKTVTRTPQASTSSSGNSIASRSPTASSPKTHEMKLSDANSFAQSQLGKNNPLVFLAPEPPPNYWARRPLHDQPPAPQPITPATQRLEVQVTPQEARDRQTAAAALMMLVRQPNRQRN